MHVFSFFALLQFLFDILLFYVRPILFFSCNESRMTFSVDKGRSFSIKDEKVFNM